MESNERRPESARCLTVDVHMKRIPLTVFLSMVLSSVDASKTGSTGQPLMVCVLASTCLDIDVNCQSGHLLSCIP